MSTNYDNSNRLALWVNEKRDRITSPHLTGQGETNEPVFASAWFSQDVSDADKSLLMQIMGRYDSRKPFLSISLTKKEGKPANTSFDGDDAGGVF